MLALLEELSEFGPFHVFRPYNDVRFAKNKAPYKLNIAAVGESEGGAVDYVHLSATGSSPAAATTPGVRPARPVPARHR
jgi:uncharacterized protein (DUF2461 family)